MKTKIQSLLTIALLVIVGGSLAQELTTNVFKPLPKLDEKGLSQQETQRNFLPMPHTGMLPAEDNPEMTKAYSERLQYMTNNPVEIQQLITVLKVANQQPAVMRKTEEARMLVHEYVARNYPDLLPALEKLNQPRKISRKNGIPSELIY